MLPRGLGRSYGDCCLDDGGTLLTTRALDRVLAFDPGTGFVRCEAGVTIGELVREFAPRGFFPPVVPGTKHVTVGGAIANDVHGKNHHRRGTFGGHVRRLELLRSTGERLVCSREENAELFAATVAGLGLTGLVTWAELALAAVPGQAIEAETVALERLDDFPALAREADAAFEHTVAWIDCTAHGERLGRGLLFRGNHAPGGAAGRSRRPLRVPFTAPAFLLNRFTVGAFNALYAAAHRRCAGRRLVSLDAFFFPLDALDRWNRLYGPGGLVQLQCALPHDGALEGTREILARIARAGAGSFLAVLKAFGPSPSPGLLSFPRPGLAVALDLPYRGAPTDRLLAELHAVVVDHAGAIYPAKDAHMSPATFARGYPRLAAFRPFVDPALSSSLWRRVQGAGPSAGAAP
jgi:FAD/FMN-containing dehydrogenase